MLESGPLRAAEPSQPVAPHVATLAVGRLEADASMDADTIARLEAGLRSGFERTRHGSLPLTLDTRGCIEARCFAARLRKSAASTLVRAEVKRKDRDFIMTVEARDRRGKVVVKTQEVCEICGVDEVVEMLTSASARVFEQVRVSPGQSVLHLDSLPHGARVELDGQTWGHTPTTLDLDAGTHTLSVSKPGFEAVTHRVTTQPGLETSTTIQLFPLHTARKLATSGALLGVGLAGLGVGLALVAIDGTEHGRKCGATDIDGPCPLVHTTKWWGLGASITGAALASAGITLLLTRSRHFKLQGAASPTGLQLRGAF